MNGITKTPRAFFSVDENPTFTKTGCDVCDVGTPAESRHLPVTGPRDFCDKGRRSRTAANSEGFDDFEGANGTLDEREAMALEGGVPPAFARVFAALQVARPASVNEECWWQAVTNIAVFLDEWGAIAERLGWNARDLIGPAFTMEALAWALKGARVMTLTSTVARLSDGRIFTVKERPDGRR